MSSYVVFKDNNVKQPLQLKQNLLTGGGGVAQGKQDYETKLLLPNSAGERMLKNNSIDGNVKVVVVIYKC